MSDIPECSQRLLTRQTRPGALCNDDGLIFWPMTAAGPHPPFCPRSSARCVMAFWCLMSTMTSQCWSWILIPVSFYGHFVTGQCFLTSSMELTRSVKYGLKVVHQEWDTGTGENKKFWLIETDFRNFPGCRRPGAAAGTGLRLPPVIWRSGSRGGAVCWAGLQYSRI